MKRLLMYLVVAIVLVSAGFSIYYVVRNNEEIYSLIADDQIFYINVGETLEIPLKRDNPSSYTELTLNSGYESYLQVDLDNWTLTGINAGISTLTFVSTNERYKGEKFEIHCYIGNGSVSHPYYIRDEKDLFNIGKGSWQLSNYYELTSDIYITKDNMLPIGVEYNQNGGLVLTEFSGSLSGGYDRYKIINANIIQGDLNYPLGGFFGKIAPSGKVENVVFENITVNGYFSYAGVIAGANYGLIGMCEVVNSSVTNLYEKGFTGGICGLNERLNGSDYFAQVNICSSNVNIDAKWVAGGAVGYNKGGVIFNCLVKTDSLQLNTYDGVDSTYSYFGGIAGISICGVDGQNYYDSYVSNCLAYINNISLSDSHVAGIFGAYYGVSGAYQSQGNYNMLFYVASSNLPLYYICDDEQIISDKNPNSAQSYGKQISVEEALKRTTYISIPNNRWDFDHVWEIEADTAIRIGYKRIDENEITYQYFPSNGSTYVITNADELSQAFDLMRSKPTKNLVFEVTESIVFDCDYDIWQPIGTKDQPFAGQFIMDDDVTITIKKLTIQDEYAGIFGYIAGVNTLIKNFIVTDVKIEGTVAGVIAGFNKDATIENCQISNFEIYTTKYAGGIAGYNGGIIKDCLISSEILTDENGEIIFDDITGEPVYVSSGFGGYIELADDYYDTVYIGGTVGKNIGSVSSIISNKIDMKILGSYGTVCVGGLSGLNEGDIIDADVSNMTISASDYKGKAYAGGLVGHQSAGKIVSSMVNETNNIKFFIDNQNVLAGGLAGFIEKNSAIQYCAVGTMTISAYSVGGFVGVCNGQIIQSYVSDSCEILGRYVGGFTCSLSGTINDCMTACNISGSEIEAGMTVYLRKNSLINYCYIAPKFRVSTENEGLLGSLLNKKTYAETYSAFRARPDNFGKIINTVIVGDFKTTDLLGYTIFTDDKIKINEQEAIIQTSFLTWAMDVIATNLEYVQGGATALVNLGFNEGIWNFTLNGNGVFALPIKAAEVKNFFDNR